MGRVVLLALGLALGLALVAAVIEWRAPERAYTVAQVRVGLARQPAAWAGRTLLVRGIAAASSWAIGPMSAVGRECYRPVPPSGGPGSCPLVAPQGTAPQGATVYLWLIDDSPRSVRFNLAPSIFMAQMAHPSNTTILVLAVQPAVPNPLIALVRRLLPFAPFLPAPGPTQVPGGVARLYRVRLRPTSAAPCASPNPLFTSLTCAEGALVDTQP